MPLPGTWPRATFWGVWRAAGLSQTSASSDSRTRDGQLPSCDGSFPSLDCRVAPTLGKECESRSVVSSSLRPHGLKVHGILQARILEWVSHFLLQGIFPTQGSNQGLPHCRQILDQLSHKGSLRIPEWDLPNPGIGPGSPTFYLGGFSTN